MPKPGQIRLLVGAGIPTCAVQLIEHIHNADLKQFVPTEIVWLVERLDTGERIRVVRGALKGQLTDLEAIAWAAKTS
jgi:hypothetical protein